MKTQLTILLVLVTCFMTAQAKAQFKELTKLVPSDANVLVLVNHEDLMASAFAESNDWAKKHESAYSSGLAAIPPGVEDHILAGSIDLELGTSNWEMAIIKDKDGVTPTAQVAKMFGGTVETIAGSKAVVVPGNTYLVQFGDTIAGGISPSDRQKTSRWIRNAKNSTSDSISEYLKTAAHYSNKFGVDIVMSVDLQDAIPEHELASVASLSEDSEKVSMLLRTIKGMTLGINVTDKISGKILLDFGADASSIKAQGKKLIINALGDYGMMVDDVKEWTASVQGNQFQLEGDLSERGMRRLLTIVQPSGFIRGDFADSNSSEAVSKDASNIRYIQSVLGLQSDLHDHDGQTIHLHSAWLQKTIDKIESLSVVKVDDELVEFSASLTDAYRDVLEIVSKERSQERIGKANVRGANYGYRYGYRGRRYGTSTQSQRKSIQEKDRAEGAREIQSKLSEVNKMVRDFKNAMSKKYGKDF